MTRILRLVGATLVLAGGAVHLQLALDGYGTSDIVTLFALNAIASAVVAGYLALRDDPVGPLLGIGMTVSTLLAFGLSRVGDGVLDFRETGFNPGPQATLTVIAEIGALAALAMLVQRSSGLRRLRVLA